MRQTFGRVDKNGDGRVNKADLLLAMKRMPDLAKTLRMSKSAVREGDGSMQEFERAFERLDRDQSGDLDWKEFSAVLVQCVTQTWASPNASDRAPRDSAPLWSVHSRVALHSLPMWLTRTGLFSNMYLSQNSS